MARDRGVITFNSDGPLNGRQLLKVLEHLKAAGWTYEHDGRVLVSPLSTEEIEYGGVALNREALEELIDAKRSRREKLLLLLLEPNGDFAFTLFQDSEGFSVFLGDNSKDISGHLIVDYGYYLSVFLPVMIELKGSFGLNISAYVDRV